MNFVLHPSSERSSLPPVQSKRGGQSNSAPHPPSPQTAPPLSSHNPQKSSSAQSKTQDRQHDRSSPFPPPSLPSIHSMTRTSSNGTDPWSQADSETEYRAWAPGAIYRQPVNNSSNSHIDPALRDPALDGPFLTPSYDSPYRSSSSDPPPAPVTQQITATIASRDPYTRTLIGPLAANACRLADEHKKPGIFFLFQDLSIRTEGIRFPPNTTGKKMEMLISRDFSYKAATIQRRSVSKSVPHAIAFNIIFADHRHLKQELLAFTTTSHLYSLRLSPNPLKCSPQSDFLACQVRVKVQSASCTRCRLRLIRHNCSFSRSRKSRAEDSPGRISCATISQTVLLMSSLAQPTRVKQTSSAGRL